MRLSDFDYTLPEELIAQEPLPERDHSRLLVLDRRTGAYWDRFFYQFPEEVAPGSVLVLNNTRVFPARLFGRRRGFTGRIELLLLRRQEGTRWEALVKPGRIARPGTEVIFDEGRLRARIIMSHGEGKYLVEFLCPEEEVETWIDRIGVPPLPPYIRRPDTASFARDLLRYQTIYAKYRGSVAAPTAGFHFTERVFAALRERGVHIVELTLHVGYGTFKPVRTEEVERHHMEGEEFVIPPETADAINAARRSGRSIIAVGTTTVRALESAADSEGFVRAGAGWTELFIYPGYRFKVIDGLVTNFHLPRSTLLMLVCAFAGREHILRAYEHAVAMRYRFYSYGDAMFIR
jgi:S-adenosylmethionine:tRNA ribosyltransferase-isomerase